MDEPMIIYFVLISSLVLTKDILNKSRRYIENIKKTTLGIFNNNIR